MDQALKSMASRLGVFATGCAVAWECWLPDIPGCEGESYCGPCAVAMHGFDAAVGMWHPRAIDGGWAERHESDTCLHCDRCGVILGYTLTEHGFYRELDHYAANPCLHLTPEEAYHIEAMLDAGVWADDQAARCQAFIVGWLALAFVPALPAPPK